MLHAASICSLDSGINWPSWPAMAQLTTTTYLDYTMLHAASICSLNSSIPHSIMAGHGLTDHINLPWSGGAACTLLCLQSWRQCLPLSCLPTAYWSRQPTLVRWCCMYPHQPTLVRWCCMYPHQPTLVRWCCMYPHQPTLVRWCCMYPHQPTLVR